MIITSDRKPLTFVKKTTIQDTTVFLNPTLKDDQNFGIIKVNKFRAFREFLAQHFLLNCVNENFKNQSLIDVQLIKYNNLRKSKWNNKSKHKLFKKQL